MAEKNVSFEGISIKGKVNVLKKKNLRKKRSDPKFINYLLECLDTGKHDHMLYYVNGARKEFVVIYTDKKNKRIWKEKDVSLFKDLNQHLEYKLKRKHDHDKDEDWKTRFRANMSKTFGKYIKEIDSKNIDKCKRRVKYEILERPKPLVGKAKNNDGDTERQSPRKKITETKNMKVSLQEYSQVEFLNSLTSIPQGNHGNLEKKGDSKIVSNDCLENDGINKIISKGSLEKEVNKECHYLCFSGNLDMGVNRNDEMSFMGENGSDEMSFIGKNRNDEMSFIGKNRNYEMSFMGENRSNEMSFKGENRSDKMELSDNDLGLPQFAWDYLLHDECESLKYDPFFGNVTDKDEENINNIGDKSDWHSNFANFSLVDEDDNIIFR